MKKILLALPLLLLLSCAGKQYNFNEGPPRLQCKADNMFANVGQPWQWYCLIAGDISKYDQSLIGVEIVTKDREEYPQRSIIGEGLKRVYNYRSIFDEEYYLDLTGHHKHQEGDQLVDPHDPTYPAEPIEGLEQSLNGDFWLQITIFEVTDYNPVTHEGVSKQLSRTKIRGHLNCLQCSV